MTDTTQTHSRSFFAPVTSFFKALGHGIIQASENSGRMKELQRFNAMSDAQLAQRGLKRDDIVRHVFRGYF